LIDIFQFFGIPPTNLGILVTGAVDQKVFQMMDYSVTIIFKDVLKRLENITSLKNVVIPLVLFWGGLNKDSAVNGC